MEIKTEGDLILDADTDIRKATKGKTTVTDTLLYIETDDEHIIIPLARVRSVIVKKRK